LDIFTPANKIRNKYKIATLISFLFLKKFAKEATIKTRNETLKDSLIKIVCCSSIGELSAKLNNRIDSDNFNLLFVKKLSMTFAQYTQANILTKH
jgi:hypothetical protein